MARVHVIATSYNRPQSALTLLSDFEAVQGRHELSVTLYDDHSPADYTPVKDRLAVKGWRYVRLPVNHGKRHYCRLCTQAFREAMKVHADYYIFVQDDMRLCEQFLDRAIQLWDSIEDEQKTTLYLFRDPAAGDTRWTGISPTMMGSVDKMGWVDCATFMFQRKFLDVMVGGLQEPPVRWFRDPSRSSGTGRQMSVLLHKAACSMYRAAQSLVVHTHVTSEMNTDLRKALPMPTAEFIDGTDKADQLAKQDTVTVSLAALPSRQEALQEVVRRLLPQVDKLNVYLNGFPTVPDFLNHPRIEVARSQDHGDNGDAGKFFWADTVVGYHLTCDDDIAYPPDYVRRHVIALESYRKGAVVGIHGALLLSPLRDYYESRRGFHYRTALVSPTPVHVLGTGTVAYHTSTFKVSHRDFKVANMADIWFAMLGQKQQVPFICLPRKANWLTDIKGSGRSSIYSESMQNSGSPQDTRRIQTQTVQSHYPWTAYESRGQAAALRKAAFLVPTTDRPELLRACLDSLAQQEIPAGWMCETIVAGDPDDKGKAVAASLGLRYVDTVMPYPGHKLNAAAMATDAELLLEADDDDLQSPLRLKAAVEARMRGALWSSSSLVRFLDVESGAVSEWAGPGALVGTTLTMDRALWDRLGGWPSVAKGKEGLLGRRIKALKNVPACTDLGPDIGQETLCLQHEDNLWPRPFPPQGEVVHKGVFRVTGLGHYSTNLTPDQALILKGVLK